MSFAGVGKTRRLRAWNLSFRSGPRDACGQRRIGPGSARERRSACDFTGPVSGALKMLASALAGGMPSTGACSDLDAALPPWQVSVCGRVVDGPGENSCVDGCQCCRQLSAGCRSKVCQGCLKQGADVARGSIGVPITPFLSVARAGGSALPSEKRECDVALVEVTLAFELRDLPVGGC